MPAPEVEVAPAVPRAAVPEAPDAAEDGGWGLCVAGEICGEGGGGREGCCEGGEVRRVGCVEGG